MEHLEQDDRHDAPAPAQEQHDRGEALQREHSPLREQKDGGMVQQRSGEEGAAAHDRPRERRPGQPVQVAEPDDLRVRREEVRRDSRHLDAAQRPTGGLATGPASKGRTRHGRVGDRPLVEDDVERLGRREQIYIGRYITREHVAGEVNQVDPTGGGEVIERDGLMPIRRQTLCQIRADKSGRAGDQNAHCTSQSGDSKAIG